MQVTCTKVSSLGNITRKEREENKENGDPERNGYLKLGDTSGVWKSRNGK